MPEGIPYASTNVVAGAGLDLNYLGSHCFAYSGTFESVDGSQTMLSFQTGNDYIKGLFTFNGPVRIAGASAGGSAVYQIKFNGVVVALGKVESSDVPVQGFQEVIIPPYTVVEFTSRCDEDTANELITAIFTGKLYQ
tara:strand:+ start:418 stop:828 length:411 start_codon:yes stop_codon:yes gene_type:complete